MEIKGQIIVYSIVGCPHCMKAKDTLQNLHLPFVDISLDSFPQCREFVRESTGKSTVPQIFFNAIHVGGNDDFQKVVENKAEFDKLLDEVKTNAPPADAPALPDPSTAVDSSSNGEFVCEPDEYARLVEDLKQSKLIKDNRSGFRVHKNSFRGRDFVNWVIKTKGLDEGAAIEMGQMLITKHFGHSVHNQAGSFKNDDTIYRLLEDDDSSALNAGQTSQCATRSVNELGEDLRRLILKIYSSFLSADGKRVNYKGIGESPDFQKYIELTKELTRVDVQSASREEKIAFFINVYNALVIHANIVRGPPVNLWQRYKFFNTVCYIIGGSTYSLQDIENGVLRANRKGVGMLFRPFGRGDVRLSVVLPSAEPLIHFALVCGAKSCPPIKTYSANGVDAQLKLAAEAFLEGDDACQVVTSKQEVSLSMIFKWYREDFGKDSNQVLQFIVDHMGHGEKKSQLQELLKSQKVKVSYLPYDWGTNTK